MSRMYRGQLLICYLCFDITILPLFPLFVCLSDHRATNAQSLTGCFAFLNSLTSRGGKTGAKTQPQADDGVTLVVDNKG
jgi:hypothetical protein